MKAISQEYKNTIKVIGRQIDSKITYTIDGVDYELGADKLNSVTPHYNANILKSVMKQLDIDSNTDIPLGTVLNYQFGVLVNEQYEYINYGNYIVYSSEKQEDLNSYKIVCYDKMLYSMKDYESFATYPITIRDYLIALSTHLGLTFKNATDTFVNYNRTIPSELYLDANGNSLDYTFRDVLDELAQVTASTICINELTDELEVRYINDTNDTIDEEYFKDINVKFGQLYGPINTISFKRSAESDVISKSYPEDLPDEDKKEISIVGNQILNDNNRADYIDEILNKLLGLTYSINDFASTGITYYELCDKYNVSIGGNIYTCIMFNDEVLVTQGLEENIHNEMPKESVTDYTKADKTDRRINQTYLIVDKQNQTIESVVSQTIDTGNPDSTVNKVSRLTQKVDKLESEISDVADLTVSGESSYATLNLDNINQSEPITITIHPIIDNISYLYPANNLYPSSTTYLKSRKIRFHNNTTNEEFDYEIPDDLLYYNNENYDEFNLGYNEQTCTITKKCEYDANGNVILKQTPVTTSYTYPTINLTDGDYTISILNHSNAYLFVRLMSKNIYTTQFYTKSETNSLINQTSQSIDLSVNQKLSNYSTTTEMNSAINMKANEINQTVSQKVGKDEVISKINQTSEQITINANKISLAGKTIEMTSDNIAINSTNFQVDKNGNIKATNGEFSGKIASSSGSIGGWTIDSNGINNGAVFLHSDGSSTIYTVADLFIIRGYIQGITGFEFTNPTMIRHYDLNNDGVVNAQDYVILKNLIGLDL